MPSKDKPRQKSSLLEEKNFTWISGKKIAFYRDQKNLTQTQLGALVRASKATIVVWEGKENLRLANKKIELLKKSLEVTLEDLKKDVPRGAKSQDLLDDPVIEKYINLVNQQDRLIQRLQKELDDLRDDKGKQ